MPAKIPRTGPDGEGRRRRPCALAIGGLDPGGGAGILADLRAFEAAGAFGCAALTLFTIQSTAGLRRVRVLAAREVVEQVDEVLRHQHVRAVKLGAIGSRANVVALARLLASYAHLPVVVDTPMRATRGDGHLLAPAAIDALRARLLPIATLATLNAAEAGTIAERPVRTLADAREAARSLSASVRAVLVKGGHLEGSRAVDVLGIGGEAIDLAAPRLRLPPTHGTGCTLAALVAGRLAAGGARVDDDALVRAVRWAKRRHHAALARVLEVGAGMRVVGFG